HLEQAVALLPDSVAAQSMLAVAYGNAARVSDSDRALTEATRLTPLTAEDFLFRGHAESGLDPDRALRSLDEALRRRPTALARLVRIDVLKQSILNAPDPNKARLALEDAQWLKRQLPENALALSQSLKVHLMCYHVFGEFNDPVRCQTALE